MGSVARIEKRLRSSPWVVAALEFPAIGMWRSAKFDQVGVPDGIIAGSDRDRQVWVFCLDAPLGPAPLLSKGSVFWHITIAERRYDRVLEHAWRPSMGASLAYWSKTFHRRNDVVCALSEGLLNRRPRLVRHSLQFGL